ncbi:hypothetical protein F2Q68_00033147 [Brassica cretica]|uniref:Uncharacterized protein n=1 Tax=Brassica cretica TaxID=69181 RepID=A0A8S9GGJ8_BRACR|nr:hypothetical protein F2Q68_00033147 [Brassica cretica]
MIITNRRLREPKAISLSLSRLHLVTTRQSNEEHHKLRPTKPVDKVPEVKHGHERGRERRKGREVATTPQNGHRRPEPTPRHQNYHEPSPQTEVHTTAFG